MPTSTSLQGLSVPILLLLQLAPTATSAFLLPPFISEKLGRHSPALPSIQNNQVERVEHARVEQHQIILQEGNSGKKKVEVVEGRYSYLSATTPVRASSATPANAPVSIITGAPATITPSSSSKDTNAQKQQQQQQPESPKGTELAAALINRLFAPQPSVTYVPFSFDPKQSKPQNRQLGKRQQNSNSGIGNQGYGNSGNYNCGNFNSGNYNDGNYNSGNFNNGNYNSGNGNNGNGQSGNGNIAGPANNNQAPCGNVVISSTYAVIYQAPSTVYYNVPAVTTTVIVQQAPQVYVTSCYAVPQAPQTSVVYYSPIVQPINNPNYQYPRGCEYWAAQGYRCSGADRSGTGLVDRKGVVVWGAALGVFWGVVAML